MKKNILRSCVFFCALFFCAADLSAAMSLNVLLHEETIREMRERMVSDVVPDVIITEVYGGGGNSGAIYKNDFVELYNTTNAPVEIGGWSVQYYSATGTSASSVGIPEGKMIPARTHFLIGGASGGDAGDVLSGVDVAGTFNIAGTNGKIVLYTTAESQTLEDSRTLSLITGNAYFKDYVPFGSATPLFGSALAALTNKTSALRKKIDGAYLYTGNVGGDFEAGVPAPESSGLQTSLNPGYFARPEICVFEGKISFLASSGTVILVSDVFGRPIVSAVAVAGLNVLEVPASGILIVRIGNKSSKIHMPQSPR